MNRSLAAGSMVAGPGYRTLRLGRLRARWHVRSVLTVVVLGLLVVAAVGAHVMIGAAVSPTAALKALVGQGDPLAQTIVTQWRLPRALAAVIVGASLGVAGAIFQTVTRNPLGSPDIMGLGVGAYTGALVVMLVVGQSAFGPVAVGALIGGMLTGTVIYVLAARAGQASLRLIIVGLGISAMLSACNRWLIMTSDVNTAVQAASWGAGSLNGLTPSRVWPAAVTMIAIMVVLMAAASRLRLFSMGDEFVTTLGGRLTSDRLLLLAGGAVLTAIATAIAGPIAFIALAAPQVARLATGTSQASMLPAAFMGSLLLILSDLAAQHAFSPIQLPTGVVTVTVGGAYLILLLFREGRKA